MPASFLLATDDSELLHSWTAQVPAGTPILSLAEIKAYPALPPGMAIVVVLDSLIADRLPPLLEKAPTIVVGRAHSAAFEQLKLSRRGVRYFDYDESRSRLSEYMDLLGQLAERTAALDMVVEKNQRSTISRPPLPLPVAGNSLEIWDFLEGALESMGSRERLLAEFRRASRHVLQASHTVFFLREEAEFRADRGSSSCPTNDPLIVYLSSKPVVLDGVEWPGAPDPLAEMAARNRMALWGARLLVPMHDNGHLVGIIACGVRNDGQPYDEADKGQAVFFARLLRQLLAQSQHQYNLDRVYERTLLGERYFPNTVLLNADDEPSSDVPLAVRALIGKARHERRSQRLRPSPGQPFRAAAGMVVETQGAWAFWEEASSEIGDMAQDQRRNRLILLRDLALTLNHEIGNSLVSITSLCHGTTKSKIPAALRKSVESDVARLQKLNRDLVKLAEFSDMLPSHVDLKDVLSTIGTDLGAKIELPPDSVTIDVVPSLVEFALDALIRTVAENQPENPKKPLTVQLRSTGEGGEITGLISIQGSGLELEGIISGVSDDETPNQGRLTVFIAKEIIRLHGGEIHAGPGMGGTEILLSLRRW